MKKIFEQIIDSTFGSEWCFLLGALLATIALFKALSNGYKKDGEKTIIVLLLGIGIAFMMARTYTSAYTTGWRDGMTKGSEFSTYHVAKFFTAPVPMDKLKENVLYKVWLNMPNRNTSLVYGEDNSTSLITGLKGIPEEEEFIIRKGEVLLQAKKKITEKK